MAMNNAAVWQIYVTGPEDKVLSANPTETWFRTGFVRSSSFAMEWIQAQLTGGGGWGGKYETVLNGRHMDVDGIGRMYIRYTLPGIRHRLNPKKRGPNEIKHVDGQYPQCGPCAPCAPCGPGFESSQAMYSEGSSHGGDYEHQQPEKLEAQQTRPDGLPQHFAMYNNSIAHVNTESVSLRVNGRDIATDDYLALDIYDEISGCPGKPTDEMVGRYEDNYSLYKASQLPQERFAKLRNSFMENLGHIIPVVTITRSEFSLAVKIRDLKDCYISSDNSIPLIVDEDRQLVPSDLKVDIFIKAFFLTDEERAEIYGREHNFLMTRHQYTREIIKSNDVDCGKAASHNVQVVANGPITELVIAVQKKEHLNKKQWLNFSGNDGFDPIREISLSIDNMIRFQPTSGKQNRLIQFQEHHSCIPTRHLYNFSFANDPERSFLQPNGYLNANEIKNIVLHIKTQKDLGDAVLYVIATQLTILTIDKRGIMSTRW